MTVLEALGLAYRGLGANRLRSSLTMLGILIGVAAVILLVAVGNGASAAVQSSVQSLGSNLLIVFPGTSQSGGVRQGFGTASTLTLDDARALVGSPLTPDVVAAVPAVNERVTAVRGDLNWSTTVTGTTERFPEVRNFQVAEGSFFTAGQVDESAKVVVIGQTVQQNLFGEASAVGRLVQVDRQAFRVIGVFASKGASGFFNQDDVVVMPITTDWAYLTGGHPVGAIFVEAKPGAQALTYAQGEVAQLLLERHHIADPALADFQVASQADILSTASQITGVLTLLLAAIAAISLVVGGIGIMNIMLVTVTERTREIGIRKAIGARRRDILSQFLIESMFLSGVGGVLGILTGALGAYVLGRFPIQITPLVTAPSVALAFGVSVAIGLFFGIYPANRAARMSPIEALRYE